MASEPAYQPFLVTVARKERLSPHFMRIIFTGPELSHFADHGYGQHVKLILPLDATASDGSAASVDTHLPQPHASDDANLSNQPATDPQDPFFAALLAPDAIARMDWWDQWRALPADRRNPMRTYTIRSVRQTRHNGQTRHEVVVDFVTHESAGPGGSFAIASRIGDRAVLIGPNSRNPASADSISFQPGEAHHILLAGDETAAPAIAAIAESLTRDGWRGEVDAFIEVPETADVSALRIPSSNTMSSSGIATSQPHDTGINAEARVTLHRHWLARNGQARGTLLLDGVKHRYTSRNAHAATQESASTAASPEAAINDSAGLWPSTPDYAWIAAEATTTHALRRLLVEDFNLPKPAVTFYSYWREGKPEI